MNRAKKEEAKFDKGWIGIGIALGALVPMVALPFSLATPILGVVSAVGILYACFVPL